jgi:AAA15 family ATPase/GTPase
MFHSFTVKNFRCFRELTLEPLQRINLIAGKNNTGKTALLEAIHLHSYPRDCELPFLVNERRVASIFLGSSCRSAKVDAAAFSDLEVANRQDEILPPLRMLEPRLQRLSIVLLGEEAVLHGHIGPSRLVPLPFMGEGIRRLLSILLAINQAKGGNVLIDEVENGLHHSVMVKVWQAIAEAARQADVQVFATTHSYECIQAAQQAFQPQDSGVLRLFRLDRIQDQIRVVEYDQETLNYAIEMTHEVR